MAPSPKAGFTYRSASGLLASRSGTYTLRPAPIRAPPALCTPPTTTAVSHATDVKVWK
jgi:hypothetical protein